MRHGTIAGVLTRAEATQQQIMSLALGHQTHPQITQITQIQEKN
jgi:hypothetical protein